MTKTAGDNLHAGNGTTILSVAQPALQLAAASVSSNSSEFYGIEFYRIKFTNPAPIYIVHRHWIQIVQLLSSFPQSGD